MRFSISLGEINRASVIRSVIRKYHFLEDDEALLLSVYDHMLDSIEPYAIYRINHRTTGVKYIDESQTAVCAITLGGAMDEILDGYKEDSLLEEAYMADCIAGELLLRMYDIFNREYSKFHRRYVNKYVFVGDTIPIDRMQVILDDIYDNCPVEDREIAANEYGVLIPSKSVVFYALLTDNPKQICAGICGSCGRSDCEQGRMELQEENKSTVMLNYGIQRIFSNLKEVPNG